LQRRKMARKKNGKVTPKRLKKSDQGLVFIS